MGILGLEQLLFMSQFDVDNTQAVLSLSHHSLIGFVPAFLQFQRFPFAVAGITFTALCVRLLHGGFLKRHFYNAQTAPPDIDAFHRVYCMSTVYFNFLFQAEYLFFSLSSGSGMNRKVL